MKQLVAIVDDDEQVRRALRRLLVSFSYQTADFASGEEFLASLQCASPRCAVVDLHMPGLTGLDVLLRIRLDGLRIPLIILAGFDQTGMRAKCMDAGAMGYMIKPTEPTEIASTIKAAIDIE